MDLNTRECNVKLTKEVLEMSKILLKNEHLKYIEEIVQLTNIHKKKQTKLVFIQGLSKMVIELWGALER